MLARVSSALTKFITPIVNSIGVGIHSDRRNGQGFERFKDEQSKGKNSSPPDIKQTKTAEVSDVDSSRVKKEEIKAAPQEFVQLFTLLQKTKTRMNKFRCTMLYDLNFRNRKKKKVKGAMLDTSV